MTGTLVEYSRKQTAQQRELSLDRNTKDAIADYCRERWPAGTAKLAAREWDLTLDEARGVVAGRTSLTTYDKIKKAGGWPVIFAVEARVIGHGADQFLHQLRQSHEADGRRLAALFGGLLPGADPGPVRDTGGRALGGEPLRPDPRVRVGER